MKNKRLLRPKEAAYELGVSTKTIHRWDQAGKLRTVRTVGKQRRIPIEEIWRLCRQEKRAERCVLYARVSSVRQEQDGNLARQTERLKEAATQRGYEVVAVLTEQASSLNERRKGMKKLLWLIGEQAFGWKDVRLEVLDPPKQQEPTEELIQDMLTIVTVFAGRLYGHRAKGVRKRVGTMLKACEQEEQANGTGKPHHEAAP
jgi:putative resolvase